MDNLLTPSSRLASWQLAALTLAGLIGGLSTAQAQYANGAYGTDTGTSTVYGTATTSQGNAASDPTSARLGSALGSGTRNTQRTGVQQQSSLTPQQGPAQALQQPGTMPTPLYVPTEFETYVQQLVAPRPIRRLGADALSSPEPLDMGESSPLVPDDYIVVPGDELGVSIWGGVDADLSLIVDRSGKVNIPRVGQVMVAGARKADLSRLISKQVGRMFRNFDLSVSVNRLRGIRVYVTGFASRPGMYTVSNLSTLSTALIKAGGPSAAGSFRFIQVKRRGKPAVDFDMYELLAQGNRSNDVVLQPDDVIHIGPIGQEAAVIGSVNQPSVVELKKGETLGQILRYLGGFNSVADEGRATIERLSDRNGSRIVELVLPTQLDTELQRGDVVRAFSRIEAKIPLGRQNKRVVVEGEVLSPGQYVLPANSTIQDALARAGGLTTNAFAFGTSFTRESVRLAQEENYDRALRDLETDLTRSATTQRTATADEVRAQDARTAAASQLVARLRAVRPSGRVVLQLPIDAKALPSLTLEDGDRIYVPARPTSIGVFGSVFNASNYLYESGFTVSDFLQLAGGPTAGADASSTFVIRANGSVVSNLQGASWFRSNQLSRIEALPGDTIFVPEEMNKTTFTQAAKDWTQILYQLGLGAAALNAVK